MAFENLTSRLNMALRRFVHKDYLNEKDIDEMMKEVRLSLLEADVNIKVVNSFINDVKQKALGEKIMKGLNPGQQVVKVVSDELTKVLGSEEVTLKFSEKAPTVYMLIGLQGAGKTTHAGKLAKYIEKNYSKKVMLVACDVYRPAAIDQLKTVGASVNVTVFEEGNINPVKITEDALKKAKAEEYDLVIIDTAGRLEIDNALVDELKQIKKLADPTEILLTVDSMMGQAAAQVADTFNKEVGITGVILTKLDGDQRGGAALSVKSITGVPIKFSGTGEKMDDIEVFYPERVAGRILGMGDVLTLIEKAEDALSEEDSQKLMEKMMNGTFDYNDLLKQIKMINRMGRLSGLLKLIPGMGQLSQLQNIDDDSLDFVKVIINSMTKEERRNPELIEYSSSRKRRIAQGSGRSVSDVNKLEQMLEKQKKAFKMMAGMDESKLEEQAKRFENGEIRGFDPNYKSRGKGR
ncbi:MAG: signal recognition particle protein [Gammaproteobacteria bacterium]|nr:signal recognition particle protein [Gammaproteobacteria bacterium]